MSADTKNGQVQVTDEENSVDQKLKNQVLKLRQSVDEDERRLYVDRLRDPEMQYTRQAANQDWALSIRQYLRSMKRLWDDRGDISGVGYYWAGDKNAAGERLQLGSVELTPPDTQDRQFSMVAHKDADPRELRRALRLPRGVELPEPYIRPFVGLSDVLNNKVVEKAWTVTVDDTGPPRAHETRVLPAAKPVPKHILEATVEAADAFLQQAGLGFETSLPDYMGGEEPGI